MGGSNLTHYATMPAPVPIINMNTAFNYLCLQFKYNVNQMLLEFLSIYVIFREKCKWISNKLKDLLSKKKKGVISIRNTTHTHKGMEK